MRILPLILAGAMVLLSPLAQGAPAVVENPVDGLASAEYWTVYSTLLASGNLDKDAKVASVLLHEPDKNYVLAWKAGDPLERSADVVISEKGRTYEATVDITGKKLTYWKEVKDAYAPTLSSELFGGDYIKNDPRVLAALSKRGISDLRMVNCLALPGGYVGLPEQAQGRVAWGGCTYGLGSERVWGREVAGLFFVVDPVARKVLRVSDYGAAPMPVADEDYAFDNGSGGAAFPGLHPLSLFAPAGASYTIDKGEVSWENWRFRFRLDPRSGVIVNLAGVMDNGQFRSILYQGSLSELFVPYMGKDESTQSRVFIDSGEYYAATGGFIKPLAPGVDCPTTAQYFGGTFYAETGAPSSQPQLACLYERTSGDPSWRHGEGGVAGRPSRELVLRSAAVIGNYDYLVDWRFQENGSIIIGVAATGIVETTSVDRDPLKEAAMAEMTEYGHLVDKGTEAFNHDHFFSFRLDIDVDGPKNSFMVDRLVPQRLPAGGSRKSIWVMKSSMAPSELGAISDLDIHHPAMWRFINPAHRGPVGYPSSIEIMPGQTGVSLLSPDDWPQKRAGFSAHTLWVSPYQPSEHYAAGLYPTGSKGTDGLAVWTKADRNIEDTDIVAWYTVGFHHVPRAEDWPVMPVMWHEFEIRPYDFFAHNPLMNRSMQP